MVLFRNVDLVPMTEEKLVADQTVRVEGARIVELGHSQDLRPGNGETVIDGHGAYLMPGLADMHMHTRPDWLADRWPVSPFSLYLANGVTTIRDNGPLAEARACVLRWRDQLRDGALSGPTIYSAGPPLFGPVDDAAKAVREQKAQGFDFIKLYSFLSQDEFQQAMSAARESGMYVVGHIPFAVGLEGVLAEGMDEIAHLEELDFELIEFDRRADLQSDEWFAYIMGEAARQYELGQSVDVDKLTTRLMEAIPLVVEMLRDAPTCVCTTMVVGQTIVQKLFEPHAFLARQENRYLPADYFEAFSRGEERHQMQFRGHEGLALFKAQIERALLTGLHHAGVPLILGTDAGTGSLGLVPGFAVHDELRILTDNGLTPYEAITAGTVNACAVVRKMTGKGNFGTIEAGKRADLLLVRDNPLDDVANIQHPVGVMASGRWYPREALARMVALGA